MGDTIRWGIIGPGKIAHSFAKDLKLVSDGVLTAVASRDITKAELFAKEYNAKHAFGSYEELFNCVEVDAIYVATPHNLHAQWSISAMDHGKHVLCEKPMGVNLTEVKEMIASALQNQVFLMEALWSRFNPTIRKVKQLIDTGELGDIGYLHADFAFYGLDRSEEGRVLNPYLAGGSLLDIGIYPIFLAYTMLGKPKAIKATSKFYKTGVEIQTSMIFEYEKAQALLYSGLTSNSEMKAEIAGSKGSVFIHPRWHEAQGYSMEKDGTLDKFNLPTKGKGYTYEIKEVHSCLKSGKLESALWSHQNSLDLIGLLDEVRRLAGILFPFEE
ncbi:Gfo/Idh/MocA family oxidoreductase [Ulvibacterium sp.]|uniref:Gfo/Idh/MocA family protein n=1 Tax=Ulvibacterium sp. TaxID=2665914 RepID=UPI002638E0B4|nr:Gfo/Idh/MocA family oxidoreductase [Ulvibacterium sp.]